jgi:hypothetical protein
MSKMPLKDIDNPRCQFKSDLEKDAVQMRLDGPTLRSVAAIVGDVQLMNGVYSIAGLAETTRSFLISRGPLANWSRASMYSSANIR